MSRWPGGDGTLPGGAERRNAGGGPGLRPAGLPFLPRPTPPPPPTYFCGRGGRTRRSPCSNVCSACWLATSAAASSPPELVARARTGKSARRPGHRKPRHGQSGPRAGKGLGGGGTGRRHRQDRPGLWAVPALFPALGGLSGLWAGLGAVLGHNFPLWRGFRGGKGVAVTCAASSSSPPCGGRPPVWPDWPVTLLSRLAAPGGGGDPRPVCPPGLSLLRPGGRAAGLILALVMLSRHIRGLGRILRGEEERKFRSR